MNKRQHKRIHLAQNFLRSPDLVRRLVRSSGIGPDDTVIDIGAGRGMITAELERLARRVIAIEKDPRLVRELRERFRGQRNVEIVECDFLRYRTDVRGYKVFANIPFNCTAAIVRKLLDRRIGMREAHLIMQREPAKKFGGLAGETLFSLMAKPYFKFEIAWRLRRTDFVPVPNVDSVLLRIVRRACPLLNDPAWPDFVTYGFTRYKANLRLAYKNVFTYQQWKRLARDNGFGLNAKPSELSFEQWVGLFRGYRSLTSGSITR